MHNKILTAVSVSVAIALFAIPTLGASAASPNGVLYMYSNSSCTTLLPQGGGIQGYILPSSGTVYIEIKGIPQALGSQISILLQYTGEPNEFISGVTLSSGNTNCVAWNVGEFGGTIQSTPNSCSTGIVKYGPNGDTTVSDFYSTMSHGGSDGGHFYWGTGSDNGVECSGTTTTTTTTTTTPGVPQFPGLGLVAVLGLAIPIVLLARRGFPTLNR